MLIDAHTSAVLLIGGGSSVGKTTAARRLAHERGIQHQALDDLVKETTDSRLHALRTPGVWQEPAEQLLNRLIAKSPALEPLISECISKHRQNGTSVVIEGEGIVPSMIPKMASEALHAVFIVELESSTLRATLARRSCSYLALPEDERDKVVEMNRLYNQWISREALAYACICLPSQPMSSLPKRIRSRC